MTFWRMDNIDVWLLAGVIFSITWAILKAMEHDYEKHEERIRRLEDDIVILYKKNRKNEKKQ